MPFFWGEVLFNPYPYHYHIEMDATSDSEMCSELMGMNNMWLALQNVEGGEDSADLNSSSTVKDEDYIKKENEELSLR